MDFFLTSQKINTLVKGANRILLITHQQPDADALGSLAAFSSWLDQLGKEYDSFCKDLPSANLSFLFDSNDLITEPKIILTTKYDLVVVFDSGDLKYAGAEKLIPRLSPAPQIINIDHHQTNEHFGKINLVDVNAASTTEILFKLFLALKIRISSPIASALLAGIVGDTYNFTNPNTNHNSLTIASKLLLKGAKLSVVSETINKNKKLEDLKLWGEVLLRLRPNSQFGIATTVVTTKDLANYPEDTEVVEGIANFLNSLTGVRAILILRQDDKTTIKGSLRTNDDLLDVSKLAKMLGGGGHRKAAGFRVDGRLEEVNSGQWQIV